MATFCSHCGFDNPRGMRFCGNCGTRLGEAPEPSPAVQSPAHFDPEQLGALVGADLMERFRRAGLEAAGQRRSVTVLFADLVGYTEISERLDSEDVYELIQDFVGLLANEVYKHEGIVDKLTGDGLMAIFGAPITHENNAERALRAALEMQAGLQSLSQKVHHRLGIELRMRIGLNAGSVVVGGVGSNLLMNYTAIGDTVNLARRLQEAAPPGATLASGSVYQQTRQLFDFQALHGLELKGVGHAVTGYQAAGLKQQPGQVRGLEGLRAPMIGRDAELTKLKGAVLALAQRGQGGFAIVTGEAGIGKSRLKSELKNAVAPFSIQRIEGSTLTYRRSVSYWVFLDLLRNTLDIGSDAPEAEVSERLKSRAVQVLGERAMEILPYLEHLLSLKPSDPAASNRIAYLDASQLRQQIFLALRDLLVAEARRRPLLLILEDLHWADDASLDLLLFLLDSVRNAPLMILGISRPLKDGPLVKIAEWAEKHLRERFIPVHLHSLSPDQSEHLLSELLAIPEMPSNLREQILGRAAGIPFYLEEILRMLIDQGIFERSEGRWQPAPGVDIASLGVPDTLQGLILARFDRLDETARRTLQIASVIGHHFTLPLLNATLARSHHPPIPPAEVEQALAHLHERDFIVPSSETSEAEEYDFRHVLMSEAIYGTILKRERRRLHGLVGEAIEELFPNRIEEQVELLARHYSWSTQLDRALHYLILAGQKAARSFINESARQHFEAALALLPEVQSTPEQKLHGFTGLGDALVLAGEYQAARENYQSAQKTIPEDEPDGGMKNRSILLRKVATTYERQGEYDQALGYLNEAQELLKDSPFQVEKAQVLNDIGWIDFRRGSLEAAETSLVKALALVENTTQYDMTASIYNRLGGIYFQKDQLDQASRYVRKSLVLREEIGDIVAVARSYNNLGLLGWKRGDWSGALANFMRSVELHANLGDVEGSILLHSNLGLLQIDRGEAEEAGKHLNSALHAAQQIGHTYVIGITFLHLSRLSVSAEDWETALDYAGRSLEIIQEIGDRDSLVDISINLGQAWLGLQDLGKARLYGEEALQLLDRPAEGQAAPQHENRGRALRLLGEIARLEGKNELAGEYLRESAAIFQASGSQLEQGRSSMALARLAGERGDETGARILLNEARLIFEHLGAKLDLRKLEKIAADLSAR